MNIVYAAVYLTVGLVLIAAGLVLRVVLKGRAERREREREESPDWWGQV